MQNDLFSFTTRQAARCIGVTVEAMRAQQRRTGGFRGVQPATLPNGRLLWPRADVLALAGQRQVTSRACIDLRATLPFFDARAMPTDDPMVEALAVALNDPRADTDTAAQVYLDDLHALQGWNAAAQGRLRAAWARLTPQQQRDATRLLARAVAPVVAGLDSDELAAAVADHLQGA